MTKLFVLMIFLQATGILTPDQVCRKVQPSPDRRSLYSHLSRLKRQGLLERAPNPRRGRLSYRLAERGAERITYLKSRKAPSGSAPC
jgi:hypothetical protein